MKTIIFAVVVCCLIQGLRGSYLKKSKSGETTCCVTFYQDLNYQGGSRELCADATYVGDSLNDKITSFKLGDNCDKVTVYQDIDYGGRSKTFTSDVKNLKDYCMEKSCIGILCDCDKKWNDRISSVKIFTA